MILKGDSMKRLLLIGAAVVMTAVPFLLKGQEFSIPAASAEARQGESADSSSITNEIVLTVQPGVHVYASEDKMFGIEFNLLNGLGTPEITLPKPEPFTDLDGSVVDVYTGTAVCTVQLPITGNPGDEWEMTGKITYQGCTDTTCYPPSEASFSISGTIPEDAVPVREEPADSGKEKTEPSADQGGSPFSKGIVLGILLYFGLGVLLSFTPCVYPMVGITVAVIGSGESSKKRTVFLTFIYVLGLSLVYAGAGVVVAVAGSAVGDFFRSAWVLVPIGMLFILLGLSMFDLFTLQTPSSWGGKVQKAGEKLKGSVPGIFLMGALSAFVVGPCISAPVAGLIIKVAETGDILRGFIYFFSLAWGMSLILFIAGSASGLLPKAGMWMERIKHVIGIVLIWAAFYFTRPFVGETAYITASIVLFALGLAALNIFRIPARSDNRKQILSTFLGIALFALFIVYIFPHHTPEQSGTVRFADLDRIAAESTNPILLDFTAPWCSICKEIDESVLQLPRIKKKLEAFTVVKLDYDTNKKLAKTFNIQGPPAFIFLDSEGNRITDRVIVEGEDLKRAILSIAP